MPAWDTLEALRAASAVLKGYDRQMNRVLPGPGYVIPYNDNAVLAAALSVRPRETSGPGRFKPLRTKPMDAVVRRTLRCPSRHS